MASPIAATPSLDGKDADRLASSVEEVALSLEEHEVRLAQAKVRREAAMSPKPGNACVSFSVSVRIMSEANMREHWAAKARRTKSLRQAGHLHTLAAVQQKVGRDAKPKSLLQHNSVVTAMLTRVAPRRLDDDNLAGGFKAFRDGMADAFEIDDRDPRVRWRYDQRTSKTYGVEVSISWEHQG